MPSDAFKQDVINIVRHTYKKFYIHAMPHPDLFVGKRGLVGEEAERGIVLVFGEYSFRDFEVTPEEVTVSMRFGGSWEHVVIPMGCISTVFNDPATPDFIFNFLIEQTESDEEPEDDGQLHAADVETEKEDNIIKVSFKKDKKPEK